MKKFYVAYSYYNLASKNYSFDSETITIEGDIRMEENFKKLLKSLSDKHGYNASRITIVNIVELL